jgi:hypothetical protein
MATVGFAIDVVNIIALMAFGDNKRDGQHPTSGN